MTDTTFVTPITNLVTDPVVINWIVTIIIAGLTFIFGLLKIPKNIAAKLVEYGVLIAGAIIKDFMDYMTKINVAHQIEFEEKRKNAGLSNQEGTEQTVGSDNIDASETVENVQT